MIIITEKKLRLEFPEDWQAIKYDKRANLSKDEPDGFHRQIIEKGGVQNIQAMDVVCKLPDANPRLQFIEVKDDRKSTVKAAARYAALFTAVMGKTAGTMTGLLLAERLNDLSLHACACLSQHPSIEVILLLIEPSPILAPAQVNGLRRLNAMDRVNSLEQRLTSKLDQWGIQFTLNNLTNRLPSPWQVREEL